MRLCCAWLEGEGLPHWSLAGSGSEQCPPFSHHLYPHPSPPPSRLFFLRLVITNFFTMHTGRAILLSCQYWSQAKDPDLILALVYVVYAQCALKSLNAYYYDAVCAVSYVFPYLWLSRVFLRYIEKPHKRCSGIFSVALSSELDAAIVTKCHGIKIYQEFHRECQTYVIPPNPSILPTKRYSWWNLFCIFAASENPVGTKIDMQSEIPSMVSHGLQNQNLLYLHALHTNSPQERFYQRHCT